MYRAFFFLLLLFACTPENAEIPDGVIEPGKMKIILTDIHLAQAAVNTRPGADTLRYSLNDYLDNILKKHGADREQFSSSLRFYTTQPELLKEIYDSVVVRLDGLQQAD